MANWKNSITRTLLVQLLLSVVIIYGIIRGLEWYTKHGEEVRLPELKGQALSKAEAQLRSLGLGVEVIDSVYSKELAPGAVAEMSPHALTNVKPGRKIFLTINAFTPQKKAIPDVKDKSLRRAESLLKGMKFTNITIKEVPGEYDGLCLRVETAGGVEIPAGTLVSIEESIVLVVTKAEEKDLLNENLEVEAIEETQDGGWFD